VAVGVRALLSRAQGKHRDALRAAEEALRLWRALRNTPNADLSLVDACEAAFELGDLGRVDELLTEAEQLRPGARTPLLDAHLAQHRSRLAALRGDAEHVEAGFKTAAAAFRELGTPFFLAVVLLEHGTWFVSQGRLEDAEPLLAEAREIFERLEARPWLERLERLERAAGPQPVTA
jgi:tetratricopeptide (TPR) repeat protein